MRKLFAGLVVLLGIVAIIPLAVIALSAPKSPPPMSSMGAQFRPIRLDNVPAPQHFQGRDGVSLQYYAYPAEPDRVAVLIHGTVGPGASMHALAEALRAAGITAYVLDIRGHGGSGRRGDIDYIGQIDDDLADFVGRLGPAKSDERRTLVGFSGGAGFAIRFAAGPYGLLFDRYVFLSPILPGAPTLRPNAGGWTNISLPRIVTIGLLDRLGIHLFDAVPVISYAVQENTAGTASYSYRLTMNFGAGRQYETYLKNIRRPALVLVGSADEQVVANQFEPLFHSLGVDIPVTIVPDMKHVDMIVNPAALRAVASAIAQR